MRLVPSAFAASGALIKLCVDGDDLATLGVGLALAGLIAFGLTFFVGQHMAWRHQDRRAGQMCPVRLQQRSAKLLRLR